MEDRITSVERIKNKRTLKEESSKPNRREILRSRKISRGLPEGLSEIIVNVDELKYSDKIFAALKSRVKSKIVNRIIDDNSLTIEERVEKLNSLINLPHIKIKISTEDREFDEVKSELQKLRIDSSRYNIKPEMHDGTLPMVVMKMEVLDKEQRLPYYVSDKLYSVFGANISRNLIKRLEVNRERERSGKRTSSWNYLGSYDYINLSDTVAELFIFSEILEYIKKQPKILEYILFKELIKHGTGHLYGRDLDENKPFIDYLVKEYGYEGLEIKSERNFSYWIDYKRIFESTGELLDVTEINLGEYSSSNIFIIMQLYGHIVYEVEEIEYEIRLEESQNSEYAASFETKKNIPLKIQRAMDNSPYKEYFGYVEYDEDTDIEKVEKLFKEYDQFAKAIGLEPEKEHSLRFRRLGKQKAKGIYYHAFKALCADLNGVSSLAHESFHMIDYNYMKQQLSKQADFMLIAESYQKLVEAFIKKLPDGNPMKTMWNSDNLYAKKYYLQRTEIFARTGEIYVKHILGLDLSVVTDCTGFAYPVENELFLQLIKKYFDKVLQSKCRAAETC